MIGMWGAYSDVYLYVAGIAMLLAFGLPLMVSPVGWAQFFRWHVPKEQELIVFLGRSMGVFVSLMAIFALDATRVPAAKPFFFDLMLATFVCMLVLHVYGALRKMQPVTENVEIGMWVVLLLATLGFYPV